MSGYKTLSNEELTSFLNDIRTNITDSDTSHFERIIKYLVYTVHVHLLALVLTPNYPLLTNMFDTVILLLTKKPFLTNLVVSDDLCRQINVLLESDCLVVVLVQNQLAHLVACYKIKNYHLLELIKQFIISMISVSLTNNNDLAFKSSLKSVLYNQCTSLINATFLAQESSELSIFQSVQILNILNNYEIYEKLMINRFNFDILLKKAWLVLQSDSDQAYLKSLMLIGLCKAIGCNDVLDFSRVNLLVSWLVSAINSGSLTDVLVDTVCECMGILHEVAVKFDILFDVKQLLSPINTDQLPLNVIQLLAVFNSNAKVNLVCLDMFNFQSKIRANDVNEKKLNDYLNSMVNLYKNINQKELWFQLYTFINAIGNFPCIYSHDYNVRVGECRRCATSNISSTRSSINDTRAIKSYYELLMTVSKQLSNDILIYNYLLALYKLYASYRPTPDAFLQLKPYLKHPNRYIRLLTVRILPLLLIHEKHLQLDEIFADMFLFLSSIEFDSPETSYFAESTIMAYTELAIISNGEWLNVLVLRLIDLLGGNNDHHINLVVSGFTYISNSKNIKPYKLLSPFLPVVAVKIIKNPKIFDKIIEICKVSKSYFLNFTREYTTPHLLDYYKYDYVQDIASATNITKEKLISKCMPKIIATYLVKEDKINDKLLMNILKNAGYYKSLNIQDIYHSSGIGVITWNVLLQARYDPTLKNKTRIYNALEHVSKIDLELSNERKRLSQSKHIERLIETHNLEIIQKVSQAIYQVSTPFFEKLLAVKVVEFMITHNIDATSSVLSQISTSLQSLIEISEYEFIAINCLNLLVKNLNVNNLISLFDIIISLIFQRFPLFEPRSKTVAIQIINVLFNHINSSKDSNYTLYYFSIPFIPDLMTHYRLDSNFKSFRNLIKPKLKIGYFPEFCRRLNTLNKFVVKQALSDFVNYTNQYQEIIQQEFSKTITNNQLFLSISQLINTLYKFKNSEDDISTKCAECLAILGSLDTNKFNLSKIKPKITLIHNFNNYTENSQFLTDFLENTIVINFWASNNPIKQMYYSFAMQEFLKVLKLNQLKFDNGKLVCSNSSVMKVWNNFNEVTKSTLIPFLNSKFIFQGKFKSQGINYPIFNLGISHDIWINTLTKDLVMNSINFESLSFLSMTSYEVIFNAFHALTSQADISMSNYLLKYLVLINLLKPNKKFFNNMILEVHEIFNVDPSHLISTDSVETLKACYNTIFDILDYLNQWKSSTVEYINNEAIYSTLKDKEIDTINSNLAIINEFITLMSNYSLFEKSAFCGNYERTILYIENNYRNGELNSDFIIQNLDQPYSLHSMYANINDLDALDGVLKSFTSQTTNIQLKSFQYNENWSVAQEAFHVLSDTNTEYKTKFLKSLNDHASYDEALSNLTSYLSTRDLLNFLPDWALIGVEASTFSGDLDQLDKWLFITETMGIPSHVDSYIMYKISKGITMKYHNPEFNLDSWFHDVFKVIGQSLDARNMSLMLHMIYDIKSIINGNDELVNYRLENVDQTFETKWKLLAIHKVINIMKNNDNGVSQILLNCSKLAREHDKFHISIASIMKAMNYNDIHETNFEYAQLLWTQGKQTDAIKIIESIELDEITVVHSRANIQLHYADWLNESNHSSSSTIIEQYTKAYSLEKNWEKPYYSLGKYYDKLLESNALSNGNYQQQIIKCFLKALTLGPTYIFEALPKFITIWLDFSQQRLNKESDKALGQILKDIQEYGKLVPNYVWYTAITQLLSRISHVHTPSVKILQEIISRVLIGYPKQALWFTLSHTHSKDKIRKERVQQILNKFSQSSEPRYLSEAEMLFSNFIEISEKKFKKGTKRVSIRDFDVVFGKFDLVIPTKTNLDIKLPHIHTKKDNLIFPKAVTFESVDEQVNIFHSLQMPKQITVRGNDGRSYRLMLKKDDTRKDAKVVELTSLINRLLSANNESRRRNLTIYNYAVIPLSPSLGVIEFVSNVITMKAIVNEERRKSGIANNDKLIFTKLDKAQKIVKTNSEAKDKLLKVFENILEHSPPVLYNWFLNQFSDPMSWYLARSSYVRSSAVMSIVGYIIGLGDRHCENILFFKTNGAILHIDFDCLFEKGSTLPTPEIVPFRLTNNMIDAMGITKVEGSFRRSCEVTDSIMRTNEHSLMNNLETLIYDPLLDWENQQNPQSHLKKVRRKLIGILEKEGLPMNVHGQVDILIQVASSNDNLCQMYGGWSPHI